MHQPADAFGFFELAAAFGKVETTLRIQSSKVKPVPGSGDGKTTDFWRPSTCERSEIRHRVLASGFPATLVEHARVSSRHHRQLRRCARSRGLGLDRPPS